MGQKGQALLASLGIEIIRAEEKALPIVFHYDFQKTTQETHSPLLITTKTGNGQN